MAENNVTWKDGAGFSEECTKQINSYFKTFESIILLSRDREPQLWRYADLDKQACNCALAEAYGETYGGELIDAIRLDVFYIPGLLPELQTLRDRVLKLQQAAQRVLDISFCKDFGEMCIKSTLVVIEALDDEIGNLLEEEGIPESIADRVYDQFENEMTEFQLQLQDDLQEDKMTAVVSCPPMPVKGYEVPAESQPKEVRESYGFSRDIFKVDLEKVLEELIREKVIVSTKETHDADLKCLDAFLFDARNDDGSRLTIESAERFLVFVQTLCESKNQMHLTGSRGTIHKWVKGKKGRYYSARTFTKGASNKRVRDMTRLLMGIKENKTGSVDGL